MAEARSLNSLGIVTCLATYPGNPARPRHAGELPHPAPSAGKSATRTAQKTALCAPCEHNLQAWFFSGKFGNFRGANCFFVFARQHGKINWETMSLTAAAIARAKLCSNPTPKSCHCRETLWQPRSARFLFAGPTPLVLGLSGSYPSALRQPSHQS